VYTTSGKAHFNRVLANSLATHIVFGIDKFSTVGDVAPLLTDRHHSPFESARVPIVGRTVVGRDIIFSTSYDSYRVGQFVANNMALVYQSGATAPQLRITKKIFNDFSADGWTGTVDLDDTNTPAAWFSEDGGACIAANTTATIQGTFGLSEYQEMDYIGIPVFWYGGSPANGTLTMVFHYYNGVTASTYTVSDTVNAAAPFKFSRSISSGVQTTTDLAQCKPNVFVARLNTGSGFAAFLANISTLWKVTLTWTCAVSTTNLYFGAPQITPDYDSDVSSIVIDVGTLASVETNLPSQYHASEFRVVGI
jgi:hypothetical protein